MTLGKLAPQVLSALVSPPSQKKLALKVELWVATAVLFGIAGIFALVGSYLWLRSEIGAVPAAFLMAIGFLVAGVGCLVGLTVQDRNRKRSGRPADTLATDVLILTMGFLDGLSRPPPRPGKPARDPDRAPTAYTNGAARPPTSQPDRSQSPLG